MSTPDSAIVDLLYLMARLRDPDSGCPWDLEQNYHSIVPHTLEECFELVDTIERGDFEHLREELGDVLFQVVFYSQLAREEGRFEFTDVVDLLLEKLVRRHPHVFPGGDLRAEFTGERPRPSAVNARWESIKRQERAAKSRQGLLADIPLALPALTRAAKLQKRASGAGFDWPDSSGVLDKLREEAEELQREIDTADHEGIKDEMGDLLFTVVNLARHLKVDPESALRSANAKFEERFNRMLQQLESASTDSADVDARQWQSLWHQAKQGES